jgi:hypothetical protein
MTILDQFRDKAARCYSCYRKLLFMRKKIAKVEQMNKQLMAQEHSSITLFKPVL